MSKENQVEIEVCEHLQKVCRTLRSNRGRPELAIPAAQWEGKLNERLRELRVQETPDLPRHKPSPELAHA